MIETGHHRIVTRRTDEDLLHAYGREGDEHALELLVERYWAAAVAQAERLLGGDPARAEDCAQEAFVRVAQHASRYPATEPFRPWFRTILLNVVRSEQRASFARWRRERRVGTRRPSGDAAWCPAASARQLDEARVLQQHVRGLPADVRRAIERATWLTAGQLAATAACAIGAAALVWSLIAPTSGPAPATRDRSGEPARTGRPGPADGFATAPGATSDASVDAGPAAASLGDRQARGRRASEAGDGAAPRDPASFVVHLGSEAKDDLAGIAVTADAVYLAGTTMATPWSPICPSTPGAPLLRVRRWASRRKSLSMWWASVVNAVPGDSLASFAIRCSRVETVPGLGLLAIFPSSGSMLWSEGAPLSIHPRAGALLAGVAAERFQFTRPLDQRQLDLRVERGAIYVAAIDAKKSSVRAVYALRGAERESRRRGLHTITAAASNTDALFLAGWFHRSLTVGHLAVDSAHRLPDLFLVRVPGPPSADG